MTEIEGDVGFRPRNRVATYRAYRLDKAGRMTGAGRVFEAPDDVTAIIRASALMGGAENEIWEGSRRVGPTLVPSETPGDTSE